MLFFTEDTPAAAVKTGCIATRVKIFCAQKIFGLDGIGCAGEKNRGGFSASAVFYLIRLLLVAAATVWFAYVLQVGS